MDRLFGIIPAGGRGSRLAPYPGPKELFPIGWQPYAVNGEVHKRPKVVSQYIVEAMVRAGVRQVLMIVGEHKYDLLRYYGNGARFGTQLAYLFQEQPEGMVHAIDLAYPWIRGGHVVFGMPDTVIHPPDALARLLAAHRERGADVTLGLFTTNRPEKFGMVEVDAAGRVIAHVDKPKETALTLMWGCAAWTPSFTELVHEVRSRGRTHGRETVLGDAIDEALERGMSVGGLHFADGFYVDIGTYDELVEADSKIREAQR
ncbi:MAG TPA: nucleotidyltransferase family protein [bacterium]|nr:nucleotidyltransferase family protein [bacterium]